MKANYTLTLQQIIKGGIPIFDFEYPMYKEEFKPVFEQMFIDEFIIDEIAHETIGQFKHRLRTKLNMIMPYYNKLYMSQELEQRILDNYDVTEEIKRIVNSEGNRTLTGEGSSNGVSKNLYKDAPKTRIDINNFDVVTNLSKDESSNNSKSSSKENNNSNNIENYTRTMKGNIGVQTDADAIIKYWQSLRNVTQEIFDNELSSLFMGIY